MYAGNVVKAMASAKHGYPHVAALFDEDVAALDPAAQPQRDAAWARLVAHARRASCWRASSACERLTPTIVEVVVRAPAAARHFQPGPVLPAAELRGAGRARARSPGEPPLLMEGIALTGAWVDQEKGLLSLIALEMGVSSRLCRLPASPASRWW